jgi:hypothetical protein
VCERYEILKTLGNENELECVVSEHERMYMLIVLD